MTHDSGTGGRGRPGWDHHRDCTCGICEFYREKIERDMAEYRKTWRDHCRRCGKKYGHPGMGIPMNDPRWWYCPECARIEQQRSDYRRRNLERELQETWQGMKVNSGR